MAKTDFGAGLRALGQGLEGMAVRQQYLDDEERRRQQIMAQLEAQRAYDQSEWTRRENETNPMVRVPAPVLDYFGMPPTQNAPLMSPLAGAPLPQVARTSAVADWNNMLPAAPKVDQPQGPDYYMQGNSGDLIPGSGNVWSAAQPGWAVQPVGLNGGVGVYRLVPRPLDGAGASGGGTDGAAKIPAAAGAFTDLALGKPEQKVTEAGATDYRHGGYAIPAPELGALPAEYPRMFQQAAADSMAANPAYMDPRNQPFLAQGIQRDIGLEPDLNRAPPFLPEGWSYDVGKQDFRTADPARFNPFRGGEKMQAVDFFKTKLLPQVEPGGVTEIELKKLIRLADEYGLTDAARREIGLPAKGGTSLNEKY